MNTLKIRLFKDKLAIVLVCIVAMMISLPLLAILGEVVLKGYKQINFDFFTKITPNTMEAMFAVQAGKIIPGGILQGLLGSFIMVGIATVVSVPIGIACGAFLYENKKSKFASTVSLVVDMLQGVPSIVFGIIVYLWMVIPMKSYSAIAGSATLVLMMLPLIIRSTEETLKMLPDTLREASLTLGAGKFRTMLNVLLPSAMSGIMTGILLAISRVVGETAPLMLTALGAMNLQANPLKPTSAVPLLIWEFYNDPNMQNMIWSASLVLVVFVLLLNFIAKKVSAKWKI